ncbi:unnamed protein product, partial [Prorocentrum cordatum]
MHNSKCAKESKRDANSIASAKKLTLATKYKELELHGLADMGVKLQESSTEVQQLERETRIAMFRARGLAGNVSHDFEAPRGAIVLAADGHLKMKKPWSGAPANEALDRNVLARHLPSGRRRTAPEGPDVAERALTQQGRCLAKRGPCLAADRREAPSVQAAEGGHVCAT